jgi:hypothetical protein
MHRKPLTMRVILRAKIEKGAAWFCGRLRPV